MKKFNWVFATIVLALSLLIAVGCSEKTGTGGGGDSRVGSVQILLGEDTLRSLPGDSASTTITVIVSSPSGSAVSGIKVNLTLADAELGFIDYADSDLLDTTNVNGRVEAFFRTFGEAGDNIIRANADGVGVERPISIRIVDDVVATLDITISPQTMLVSQLSEDSALVSVRIADDNSNAIVGISLPLTANGGRIALLPPTDASGVARTWWYSNAQFGEFFIATRAGGLHDTARVTVNELPSIPGTIVLSTDLIQIRADNCVTRATLRATLRDAFGSAIANDTVRFGVPGGIGSVPPWALTDSVGIATVQFCEHDIPTEPDSAYVIARYTPWGIYDTVGIMIHEASDITTVLLTTSTLTGTAGVDSVLLSLTALYADESPVQGYWAEFFSPSCGTLSLDSALLNSSGHTDSSVYYKMCTAIPDTLPVVYAVVGGVESNRLYFNVEPGPPAAVGISAPPIANLNETVQVIAAVVDSFGNLVNQGIPVFFNTSLGNINPATGTTDPQGLAFVNFNSGTTSGPAIITASSIGTDTATAVVNVSSGNPNSITLTVSNTSLQVSGTGGQDWSQLQANIFDANGNPVPDGVWVRFSITFAPPGGGANINNHGTLDSAQTSNGIASVTLNAGIVPGPLQFQACVTVGIQPQCATFDGITIVSGPPYLISLDIDEVGVDIGGASWDLEMSIQVVDLYQNPVRDGVAVFVEVVETDIAQIVAANVFTGNGNASGDTFPGVAFTTLRYMSEHTFDTVTVRGRTANNVLTEEMIILPLQEPFVDVYCAPGSWHFPTQGDPCHIQCQAVVQDGHEVLISDALVFYRTDRGRLYTNNNGTGPVTSYAFTGFDGIATLYLVDNEVNIFPDPLITEIPGDVTIEVVGYSDATDSQVINFRR